MLLKLILTCWRYYVHKPNVAVTFCHLFPTATSNISQLLLDFLSYFTHFLTQKPGQGRC